MVRMLSAVLAVALAAAPGLGAQTAPTAASRQLLTDVRAMNARLDAQRPSPQSIVADSERLRAGFGTLSPYAHALPADRALQQELARLSFRWLTTVSAGYRWDPSVTPYLMRTYGYLGDVYRTYPPEYQPWLWVGYAGANRLARGLVLGAANGREYERDLERFALGLVAVNALAHAAVSYVPLWAPGPQPPAPVAQPKSALKPVAVPAVDESQLDAAQREAWSDVTPRFISVSARVHQARLLLEDLATRLAARNLVLNSSDAATAVKMQGFLEDAAELAIARDFEKAAEALVRADYERTRLRNVTGQ
jgi:hypothetical protein